MLLSARRSLLLLPAQALGEVPGEAPGRRFALVEAAARRLAVPMVSRESANWRVGLATGRNQLVACAALDGAALRSLPPGTRVFLVIDCLPEDDRPPESAWSDGPVTVVTAEMVVFEWLERGATDEFRDLIQLIK